MEPSNEPIGLPEIPLHHQPALSGREQTMAIASIVLGVVGLCVSLAFGLLSMGIGILCGLPLSIAGFILGYLAMKDPSQKTLSVMGIVISSIALLIFLILIVIVGGLMVLGPAIGNVYSGINQSLAP